MPIAPFIRRRRYPVDAAVDTYGAEFVKARTEYLSIIDNPSISTGDIDYTLATWVNFDAIPIGYIAAKDDAGANGEWGLHTHTATNRVYFNVWNGGATVGTVNCITFGALSTGQWYFVVAQHDATGNTVGISINGGTFDTSATTNVTIDTGDPFTIGGRGPLGISGFDGRIAYFGFWKRKLSAGDTTALYNSGPTILYADLSAAQKVNLEAWWDLEEGSGTRVDSHGSNDLTDNNTVGRTLVVYP